MQTIPNEMILASAGSGKTWQLTNRYIGLMATQLRAGEPVTPERIVAVTFTRKAAGEFFDSILEKLAKAACDPQEGKNLASDAKDPLGAILGELTQAEYRLLLRIFIQKMPQLFLGTLDSFFSNILRAFPSEFGLAGDFEILDDHMSGVVRADVYRTVFARQPEYLKGRGDSQKEFMEAFRRATFGREEAKIRSELDQYIDSLHEVYLHASPKELWGNADTIWGNKCEWLGVDCDLKEAFEQLFTIFAQDDDISEAQMDVWENFRDQMIEHIPGTWFESKAGYLLDKLLKQWADILDEEATIIVARSGQELTPEACMLVYKIVTYIVGSELQVRLNRTRGVWHLLNLYEECYSERVRRRGKLTFQDLELLLAGHEYGNHGDAPILSQIPGDDDRLRIDYRLDSRYDHWLLDEFQDTNYVQWKVIANLIDEAVQDTTDMRSLFQVGDIKQAIYAWRGGDTRLFHDIYKQYNTHEERIKNRLLNISWRSGEDVINAVNEIFGKESVLRAVDIPKKALNRWQWQDHEVAPPNKKMEGITMMVNPQAYTEGEKVVTEDRYKLVVELLEEIQPVKRGLSCAILVQSNKSGREIVDYIRSESPSKIPVMSESNIPVATDNALNRLVLSLLTQSAHPGDTFSWKHLLLTPYREFVEREELTAASCGMRISRMVFEEGFEKVVRQTVEDIESVLPGGLDEFSQSRSEDLALAARVFDSGGSRDVEEFISYARSYTIKDPDTRSAVQVMTIHKSKGLTFDMVILPDLEGGSLSTIRRSIGVKRNSNREVEWVYDLPNKVITEIDPKLRDYRKDREAEAAYENLCKYYVALTRAKYANYLITNPRKKNSRSENFVKMLQVALEDHAHESEIGSLPVDVVYQSKLSTSNVDWYKDYTAKEVVEEPAKPEPVVIKSNRERVNRRTPSGSEKHTVTAKLLFSRDGQMAREFGTLVHALFEDIEWIEDFDISKADQRWKMLPGWTEQVLDDAIGHTTACLKSPSVRAAMKRPSPVSECWREKSFEILLNREWLSGTFDRVTIERDMMGKVVKATVLDFKTDRVKTPESIKNAIEKYQPQLETYRQVLQRMLDVPASKISLCLLFTRIGEVVEIGAK